MAVLSPPFVPAGPAQDSALLTQSPSCSAPLTSLSLWVGYWLHVKETLLHIKVVATLLESCIKFELKRASVVFTLRVLRAQVTWGWYCHRLPEDYTVSTTAGRDGFIACRSHVFDWMQFKCFTIALQSWMLAGVGKGLHHTDSNFCKEELSPCYPFTIFKGWCPIECPRYEELMDDMEAVTFLSPLVPY